jgi:hypothetical protein
MEMYSTIVETWAKDTQHLTDDLQILETAYHADHRDTLAALAGEHPPVSGLLLNETVMLDQLAIALASRLETRWGPLEELSPHLRLAELKADNVEMARQIETLLEENAQLKMDNGQLRRQLRRVVPILGRFCLRLS